MDLVLNEEQRLRQPIGTKLCLDHLYISCLLFRPCCRPTRMLTFPHIHSLTIYLFMFILSMNLGTLVAVCFEPVDCMPSPLISLCFQQGTQGNFYCVHISGTAYNAVSGYLFLWNMYLNEVLQLTVLKRYWPPERTWGHSTGGQYVQTGLFCTGNRIILEFIPCSLVNMTLWCETVVVYFNL